MSSLFFDPIRGFASKSNNIKSRVYFYSQGPKLEARAVNPEDEFKDKGACVATSLLIGGGSIAMSLLLTPTNLTGIAGAEAAASAVSMFMLGVMGIGLPILGAVCHSLYIIGSGALRNKEQFGNSCTKLELTLKFFKIALDPIASLLNALAQVCNSVLSLIYTVPSLLNGEFAEAKTNFNNSGQAFLDIFAHLTVACLGLILNAADFVRSFYISGRSGFVSQSVEFQDEEEISPSPAS